MKNAAAVKGAKGAKKVGFMMALAPMHFGQGEATSTQTVDQTETDLVNVVNYSPKTFLNVSQWLPCTTLLYIFCITMSLLCCCYGGACMIRNHLNSLPAVASVQSVSNPLGVAQRNVNDQSRNQPFPPSPQRGAAASVWYHPAAFSYPFSCPSRLEEASELPTVASVQSVSNPLGAAQRNVVEKNLEFYIDSGAAVHCCNTKEAFEFIDTEKIDTFHVVAKDLSYSSGTGNLNVEMLDTNRQAHGICVTNVAYLPDTPMNLLSVGQLKQSGWTVDVMNLTLSHSSDVNVIFDITAEGNMFKLNGKYAEDATSTLSAVTPAVTPAQRDTSDWQLCQSVFNELIAMFDTHRKCCN